jgi:uncharacterized membrane protein
MVSLSPRTARFVMAVAALLGFFFSGYLFYVYVTGAPIVCAIVSGCDIIRASEWANSFGIPRPFFGLLFYGALFQILVLRAALTKWAKPLHVITIALTVIGFIESGVLFVVQWLDLRAFCFWCLLSGIAATIIFIASLRDRPMRESTDETRASELRHYLWLLLGYVPLAILFFSWLVFWRT